MTYRTINNISFKKIISVDHTVGSGHAKFFPPFALGSDLVSEWNMGLLDDPFDEESWVNNGGWVYTHSSTNNGYITHTPGNFNTMTVNLINPIYIGEWVRIYFEVGGTTGALQIDLGGGEIVLDLEEDLSHGQYPANSGHSPEGRGYIFYIQMASENNTLTLTPSSGFDGWVDNIFICPVMGI